MSSSPVEGAHRSVASPTRSVAWLALPTLLAAADVAAQAPRWELEASGSRIGYDTVPALDAPSLSGLLEWQRPTLFGRLSSSVTGFEGGGWSLQARGDLAGWLSPFGAASPLRVEVAGTAAGSRHSAGFDSWVGRSEARLHARGRQAGAWLGMGLAAARNSFDTATVTGVAPGAGVWVQEGAVRGTLALTATRLAGETWPEASLSLGVSGERVDLGVYAGMRRTPFDGARDERWAGVAAAVWVHRTTALIVSGGKYSSDLMQGLPGGEFLSIGLRVTPRRVRPVPATVIAPMVFTAETARAGAIGFDVPGASTVEIAGDWNGWRLEPLTRDASGRWIVPGGLAPGVYRFNLRVDGARWTVPDGVPAVEDGYGDRVGLLLVSGPPGPASM